MKYILTLLLLTGIAEAQHEPSDAGLGREMANMYRPPAPHNYPAPVVVIPQGYYAPQYPPNELNRLRLNQEIIKALQADTRLKNEKYWDNFNKLPEPAK